MSPELRLLINRSKLHHGTLREVLALLPADDAELDELIAETVREHFQFGFAYIVLAALDAGRTVQARHLAGGAMMLTDHFLIGIVALKMQGEVAEPLMEALKHTRLRPQVEAATMLLIAVWCREQGDRPLPEGLIPMARGLARVKQLSEIGEPLLIAFAEFTKDAGLGAVIKERFPRPDPEKFEKVKALAGSLADDLVKIWRGPIHKLVPAAPPKVLAQGFTMRRSVARVGRNEPCPCGSGKKYKHCCIAKDEERLHFSTDVAGKTVDEVLAEPEPHLTVFKLQRAEVHEALGWDPRKLKPELQEEYFVKLAASHLLDRAVEAFEILGWAQEREVAWKHVSYFVGHAWRKDLALRLMKLRPATAGSEADLFLAFRLSLAEDNPVAQLELLEQGALKLMQTEDEQELMNFAHGLVMSKFGALGILVARSMVPLLERKRVTFLYDRLLDARDRLNLPPDDPFGEIMDERFRVKDHGEGKEAEALREAQHRLDEKAGEVRVLKEGLERLHGELKAREQAPVKDVAPTVPSAVAPVDEHALQELRRKVEGLKSALKERHLERNELRRELQKAQANLETLRSPAAAPAAGRVEDPHDAESEADLLLPPEPPTPQPVRLIEFPKDFHAGLNSLPRAVARGTLTMLGRLAAGEAAAFVGIVRLKACHGIFRQRIGSDFRLLFRLLPDRVQVVDLIPRQDLLRRIKTLG
ncbi:MAG: hypothetical protein RL514_4365 [Verrucomicrobiota bacterium]|jgi:hypothetical protein